MTSTTPSFEFVGRLMESTTVATRRLTQKEAEELTGMQLISTAVLNNGMKVSYLRIDTSDEDPKVVMCFTHAVLSLSTFFVAIPIASKTLSENELAVLGAILENSLNYRVESPRMKPNDMPIFMDAASGSEVVRHYPRTRNVPELGHTVTLNIDPFQVP